MIKRGVQRLVGVVPIDNTSGQALAGLGNGYITASVSKDGGAYAPSTNLVTEVGSGSYKLMLTAAEMTADHVMIAYTGSGVTVSFREMFTDPDYTETRAGYLDHISTRLDVTASTLATAANLALKPTLAQIEASTVLAKKTDLTSKPTLAQIEASTVLAKTTDVSAVMTLLGTPISGTVSADISATLSAALNVSVSGGGGGTGSVDLTPVLAKTDQILSTLGRPVTSISRDILEVGKLASVAAKK